jgi:hypothetical protein
MMRFGAILFAAAFSVQPLPQADGPLEPSVQNEVDHAIDKGERWLEKNFKDIGRGTRPACPRSRGTRDPTMITNPQDSNDLKAQLGLTNGQTRVEMALKLVSSQRGGGWWLTDTNAAPTRLAVKILKGL